MENKKNNSPVHLCILTGVSAKPLLGSQMRLCGRIITRK